MRVLIVDDNRDNMLTLGVLLRSEGYIVHMAKNGAEALRLAAAFPPDVALLDLVMPDRSGFDVAEELKRRYRAECPVLIAITAHDNAQSKERAGLVGFHHFVAKPYDPKTLLRLIGSLESD
jgi:CheY-like chemotaxis protein